MHLPEYHIRRSLLLYICFVGLGLLSAQSARLTVPMGHNNTISSIQFLPDGTLASGGEDTNIRYWDLASGRLIRSLYMGTTSNFGSMLSSGITPIRSQNVYGGWRESARFVNLVTGTLLDKKLDLKDGSSFTADLAYRLQGNQSLQPTGIVPGKEPISLPSPVDGVAPSGDYLFSVRGGRFFRWAYPGLQALPTVELADYPGKDAALRFLGAHNSFCFTESAQADAERIFRFWEVATGKLVGTFDDPRDTRVADIHPSGSSLLLLTTDSNGKQMIERHWLDGGEKNIAYQLPGPEEEDALRSPRLSKARYSPDGHRVIALDASRPVIYLFAADSGEFLTELRSRARVDLTQVEFLPDGEGLRFFSRNWSADGADTLDWNWTRENILTQREADVPAPRPANFIAPSLSVSDPSSTGLIVYEPAAVDEPPMRVVAGGSDSTLFLSIYLARSGGDDERREVAYAKQECAWFEQVDQREPTDTYDTTLIAVGTCQGPIMLFNGVGDYQATLKGHVDKTKNVIFSPDGKWLLSSSVDGTYRLWEVAEQRELAKLVLLNETDWVVVGPNNLFDASPRAMDLLYYVVEDERGKNEIIELSQMKDRFYDPGLLQKLLGYSSVPLRSTVGLDQVALYPEAELQIAGWDLLVNLTPRSGGIGRVALYGNGKELEEDINPNRRRKISVDLKKYGRYFFQKNKISVQVYNREESLRSANVGIPLLLSPDADLRGDDDGDDTPLALSWQEAKSAQLHVICVGTSNYAEGGENSMDLNYPNADAETMSSALQAVGCELFCTNGVNVTCLTTQEEAPAELVAAGVNWQFATKENVLNSLAEVREKARAQDVVILYLSGHGKTYTSNRKDQFHYLTHEVSPDNVGNEAATRNAVISSDELRQELNRIPAAKQVLILDACNSGAAIDDLSIRTKALSGSQIRALQQMGDRAGLYLITGSAADKVSFEAGKFGHGILTYALLKGMAGQAVRENEDRNFDIEINDLFDYAQKEVVQLSLGINGLQQPQINYPNRAGSFSIGIFDAEKTSIPLPGEKAVFIRSSLQNEDSFIDNLFLAKEITDLFRTEMANGREASLIFVDVDKYPNALRVAGRYSVDATGKIKLQARLVQAGQPPVIIATKEKPLVANNVQDLAEDLFEEVMDKLDQP